MTDYIPDIGYDYERLVQIKLNWHKKPLKHRCEWMVGPHKTYNGQFRVWQCQISGTQIFDSHRLCMKHLKMAMELPLSSDFEKKIISYWKDICNVK